MLEHSYLSHWDLDGLKPHMRYALTAGEGYSAENVSGIDAPLQKWVNYRAIDVQEEVMRAHIGLMGSSGHRDNIL